MKTKWYIKFVNKDMTPIYGNHRMKFVVGEWMPKRRVVMCKSGYHACEIDQASNWSGHYGSRAFVCLLNGPVTVGHDKVAARSVKLVFEIDTKQVVKIANREREKRIKQDGYFTPLALSKAKMDWRLDRAISAVYGDPAVDDYKFGLMNRYSKVVSKYIEKELRKLGYK